MRKMKSNEEDSERFARRSDLGNIGARFVDFRAFQRRRCSTWIEVTEGEVHPGSSILAFAFCTCKAAVTSLRYFTELDLAYALLRGGK